jgi:hypothetical protein
VERDVLDDSVALVENAQNRDALGHRRDSALPGGRGGDGLGGARRIVVLLAAASATGKREANQNRSGEPHHAYSGTHGS